MLSCLLKTAQIRNRGSIVRKPMPTTAIAESSPNARRLIPANAGKNKRHRLAKYVQCLDAKGRPWYQPDLEAYRFEVGKMARKAVVSEG